MNRRSTALLILLLGPLALAQADEQSDSQRLREVQAEIKQLQAWLKEARSEYDDLQTELQDSDKEIADLVKQAKAHEAEVLDDFPAAEAETLKRVLRRLIERYKEDSPAAFAATLAAAKSNTFSD